MRMMQDSSHKRGQANHGARALQRWAIGLMLLGLAGGEAGEAGRRVALMDFRCENVSYRSWEAAKELTVLLPAVLPARDGIEWVERKELARVEGELQLGLLGLASRHEAARAGQILGAEWACTVRSAPTTPDAGPFGSS